jgi:hypothetical protein
MAIAAPVLLEQELVLWLADAVPLADSVRDDARTQIRALIGDQIYSARRPIGTGPLAITIERVGGDVYYHLLNQASAVNQTLDITLWAKEVKSGTPVTLIAMRLSEYFRRLLSGFRGTYGALAIQQVELENEPFADAVSAADASDNWSFRYVMPYSFWFTLATMPGD